jgi:hypothetical protein
MNEQSASTLNWRKEPASSSAPWALALVIMAVVGFSFVGAVSAVSAASSAVTTHGSAVPALPAGLAKELQISHGQATVKLNSGNWGGYGLTARTNGTITEAFGEWFVPKIGCAHAPAIADQWVGIDGLADGTVEQAGTYEYCSSTTSAPVYVDWFEFYPYEAIAGVYYVSPGDLMNAYVLYNPHVTVGNGTGIYTLVVNDLDDYNASFTVTGNPSTCNANGCETGVDNSAECISEALTAQGYDLPNYKTLTFDSCDATVNGHWAGIGGLTYSDGVAHVYAITTIGAISGLTQQTVSKLTTFDYKDDAFTITWKRLD